MLCNANFKLSLICLLVLKTIVAEEYNLYGLPGLGYSVEILIGHPPQNLSVLIDTGSSVLAVASIPHQDITTHFYKENSSSFSDLEELVSARYTEGEWKAQLGEDYVKLPTAAPGIEVKAELALITNAQNFFMDNSGWQGILGLAYRPMISEGAISDVEPYLEALDRERSRIMSFSITLCGARSITDGSQSGSFKIFDDTAKSKNSNPIYRTPILQKSWYEIGILNARVISPPSLQSGESSSTLTLLSEDFQESFTKEELNVEPTEEVCRLISANYSIIDSGTTNIRLPDAIFRKIVGELKDAARVANILILDEFWYNGEAACWPEPREWSLPWFVFDVLSADDSRQYFTIAYPPKIYMRLVTAYSGRGKVPELCYKLGFERRSGSVATVLGAIAMEGLEITFNREAGWIGFQKGSCGPEVQISGPFNSSSTKPYQELCKLAKPGRQTPVETRIAQWVVAIALGIAMTLLAYLLWPCFRSLYRKSLSHSPSQISLSRTALFEHET